MFFRNIPAQPDQVVEWQGDLRAIEGTEAQLEVESNQALDAAWINFLDTNRSDDLRLIVTGVQISTLATGVFSITVGGRSLVGRTSLVPTTFSTSL